MRTVGTGNAVKSGTSRRLPIHELGLPSGFGSNGNPWEYRLMNLRNQRYLAALVVGLVLAAAGRGMGADFETETGWND